LRIAVAGGTGTLGAHVVEELRARGHDVRALSRKSAEYPVDLSTGDGLESALAGCETVVDASNSASPRSAAPTLVGGTRRLLEAGKSAGIAHHVCISIVGCERAPMAYYKVKTEQERLVEQGPLPWTIARATQFHELLGFAFDSAARWRVLPLPRARLQTVAAAEVGKAVADVAQGDPLRRRFEIGGPAVHDIRELAASWRAATGRNVAQIPVRLPGRLGRALRSGALTNEQADVLGTVTFEQWLHAAGR
jgi:uncharacterized protein YbjT (DUF2867 family)